MPAIWTTRNNPVTIEDAGANIIKLLSPAFCLLATVQKYGRNESNFSR